VLPSITNLTLGKRSSLPNVFWSTRQTNHVTNPPSSQILVVDWPSSSPLISLPRSPLPRAANLAVLRPSLSSWRHPFPPSTTDVVSSPATPFPPSLFGAVSSLHSLQQHPCSVQSGSARVLPKAQRPESLDHPRRCAWGPPGGWEPRGLPSETAGHKRGGLSEIPVELTGGRSTTAGELLSKRTLTVVPTRPSSSVGSAELLGESLSRAQWRDGPRARCPLSPWSTAVGA
jgi:hypothetical protein